MGHMGHMGASNVNVYDVCMIMMHRYIIGLIPYDVCSRAIDRSARIDCKRYATMTLRGGAAANY